MSNLGKYQEFTVAAKAAGGVDVLLRSMRRASFIKGVGVGALVMGVGLAILGEIEERRVNRQIHEEIEEALAHAEDE